VTVTTFQILTFVVALVGLVFAAASLGWNVAQFLLTGGRPKLRLIVGALTETGVITVPITVHMNRELDRLAEHNGYNRRVVGAIMTNAGRGPATVERWGLSCGEATYWVGAESLGPELPKTLDGGGAKLTVVAPIGPVERLAYAMSTTQPQADVPVRAIVELGNGRMLRSTQALTFPTNEVGRARPAGREYRPLLWWLRR
jgi:hypothetical protein